MALTEDTIVDKIEILPNGAIQIRKARRIFDDGKLIAETYHRSATVPTDDVKGITDARVKAVANLLWTPDVISAYRALRDAVKLN